MKTKIEEMAEKFEEYWKGTFLGMTPEEIIKYKNVGKDNSRIAFTAGYESAAKELAELRGEIERTVVITCEKQRAINKLESDLARITELLREAVKVVEFYGDGVALNRDTDDIREEEDSSFDEERQMSFKGKRAREFLANPEIKEVLK